jgi:hypothetical protein
MIKINAIILKKLIFFIFILILFGFNFSIATDGYVSLNKNMIDSKIDLETAKKIAYIKLNEIDKSKNYQIDDIEICFNEDDLKEFFYIFRLFPKGFIIVTTDYNLPPIIAYSLNSNIDEKTNDDIFIQLLITDIKSRLENIDIIPQDIISYRNYQWDKFLSRNDEQILNINFEQWPPEGTTPTGGWIITTWHQKEPYNIFCPLDLNSGIRSVAGCPSIAMAQILNYHKTINNVFFNDSDDYLHNYQNRYWIDNDYIEYDFPSFPELNEYLSVLEYNYKNDLSLKDENQAGLVFACGVAAKQVYTESVSGTFGVIQAYDAYIKFNCDMIELIEDDNSYLYDRIIENIKNAYPVHLAVVTPEEDSGHNLIIDGYNTDEYYHLNFGWDGQKDAWYLLPDEIPYDLTVIEGVIVDILYDDNGSNLYCDGRLNWIDTSPGATLYGNFTVENNGASESFLNWNIESYPEWGVWEFTPSNGFNLTPEDGPIKVEVKVLAPNIKDKEFIGGIKIVNNDSKGDIQYIQVSLTTPKIREIKNIDFIKSFYNIKLFQIFQIIF